MANTFPNAVKNTHIKQLKHENELLKRALRHYADQIHYEGNWWILKDCGELARNTLAKLGVDNADDKLCESRKVARNGY